MADQTLHDHADRFLPWEGSLSSDERRALSLRNLADAREEKEKQQKIITAQSSEHVLAEAERLALIQEQLLEARELRRAQTEENRRMSAVGGVFYDDAAGMQEPENHPPVFNAPQAPAPEPPRKDDGNEIDIDIPTGEKKPEKTVKSKKKKKTKQDSSNHNKHKRSAARSSAGKRYEDEESSGKKRQHSRISAGGAVALGILTGLLIGTVIYGRVQTNEIYTEIAALQTDYDDLTARNVSMKSEMESKLTVKKIEEYAEDVLGLMPLNQSQIEYIQLQTEDEVVISEPEDNFFVAINDYLVGIWEYLSGK
jgi:hypothetical protein